MSTFTVVPANQSADNNAKMIYQWLSGLSERQGKRLISGIFGGYSNIGGVDAFSLQQGKDLQALTGKFPAIYSADYARGWDACTPGEEASLIDFGCNADLIDHWKKRRTGRDQPPFTKPLFCGE